MSERFVQRAGPEEVFGSLSNDIRVAVIRALRDAEGHEAAFSDLRETVGVDVQERLVWEFPSIGDVRMAVRDAEPFRASVSYEAGGETLTVVVDETLGVVGVDS